MEKPPYPREHGSLSIVFGGRYGVKGNRQLYKCVPVDGSKPHRFAPVLPRDPQREDRCLGGEVAQRRYCLRANMAASARPMSRSTFSSCPSWTTPTDAVPPPAASISSFTWS